MARRYFKRERSLLQKRRCITSLREFITKLQNKLGSGRWNIACALQPSAANRMQGIVPTVKSLVRRLHPETVRICFLSPGWSTHLKGPGGLIPNQGEVEKLWAIDGVEVMSINATSRTSNGLLLSDFFNFM